MVIEPDGQICCICSSLCHKKCLIELDEIYTCVACVANNENINQPKGTIEDSNMLYALDHTMNTEETLVKQPNEDIQTISKPIPKPRKTKRNETTINKNADETKTKLSELRTRETKLRKQDEQMKMKEKSLNGLDSNRILLESRCQQLEARNFELEQTVKLLKRRIQANDDLTITNDPKSHVPNTQTHESNVYGKMKQQIDSRIAEMHLKLTNVVLDEMDRQLDKIKLFSDQPDSTEHAQTQKPTINVEPVIEKMPTCIAKSNVQRLTGQPLAYAPKPVQVQRNNALNHQPSLSRMGVSSAYPTQHVQNHQTRTSERINLQTAHHSQLGIHETGATHMVGNGSIHYQPQNFLNYPSLYTQLM